MAKQTVTITQATIRIGGKKKDKPPTQVSGYYRKDGTFVKPHTRKASA